MENNKIENYYKNINKNIINNYVKEYNLKNLLELTTITDLYIFSKKKNNEWKLKEKNLLIKECEYKRKIKIAEINKELKNLSKKKNIIVEVKKKNSNILNQIETIDNLINTIEKEYPNIENFIEKFSN